MSERIATRHERVYALTREDFDRAVRCHNPRVTPHQLARAWAMLEAQRANWRRVQRVWLDCIERGQLP